MSTGDEDKPWLKKSTTKSSPGRWKGLAVVMIIINLLLLVITVAIIVVWRIDRDNREFTIDTNNFCLPCGSLSLHEDDDRYNLGKYKNRTDDAGHSICCADTAEKLNQLVDLFVTKKYREERARNPVYCSTGSAGGESKNHSAARVVGIKLNDKKEIYQPTVLIWDDGSAHSFINKNIKYTSTGNLQILKKGFYYVYSQVTFLEQKTTNTDVNDRAKYVPFSHFIYRQKVDMPNKPPEKLLESSQSKCELQSESSNSTSYLGAVFYMEKNDKVMVKVTYPNKITSSTYSNYFGLHMI